MGRSSDPYTPLSIFLIFFLFLSLFCISCNGFSGNRISNSVSSDRSLLALQRRRDQQIPNCGEKVSALQCSQSPKCRWCRSNLIDDTCFSRPEALRLPQQKSVGETMVEILEFENILSLRYQVRDCYGEKEKMVHLPKTGRRPATFPEKGQDWEKSNQV